MTQEKLKPIVPTKHKTPKAVAKALLKLYRDPRRHAQHTYMRGVSGRPVVQERAAVSCCIMGGVGLFMHGSSDEAQQEVVGAFNAAAAKSQDNRTIGCVWVNDHVGIDGVRKLLQEVIKA